MGLFNPQCRPVLIGSLPLQNHRQAIELILNYTPEFPLWPQLPQNPREGMVRQFLSGMPGLVDDAERFWIDSGREGFETEMVAFYEEQMAAEEDDGILDTSRFGLGPDTAPGFLILEDSVRKMADKPRGLKGQVTGPITTGIGVTDHQGRNIIFDDNLRDMMVRLLALKASWQVNRLKRLGCVEPPMVFIDEPGIVSFGSSAYIAITREMVTQSLETIIAAIHSAGGRAGIHICANGDFSQALESAADLISFDAYTYFDNFILYRTQLEAFIARGGGLAWGIVPTLDPDVVDGVNTGMLLEKWMAQLEELKTMGLPERALLDQSLIAPACGAGTVTPDRAGKILAMTREVSSEVRARMGYC